MPYSLNPLPELTHRIRKFPHPRNGKFPHPRNEKNALRLTVNWDYYTKALLDLALASSIIILLQTYDDHYLRRSETSSPILK